MPFTAKAITLTPDEQSELEQLTQSRTLPAGDVFRARLILMLAEGVPYRTIQERLDMTVPTIFRWTNRFEKQRVTGLLEIRHPGQKPSVITPALQARVLQLCRRKPQDGSTHWSCRKLARELKISIGHGAADPAPSRSEAASTEAVDCTLIVDWRRRVFNIVLECNPIVMTLNSRTGVLKLRIN